MALDPFVLVGYGVAALHIILAGVVLWFGTGTRANHALAAFLGAKGIFVGSAASAFAAGIDAVSLGFLMFNYWLITLPLLALAFVAVYPARRSWARPPRGAVLAVGLLVVGAVLLALAFGDIRRMYHPGGGYGALANVVEFLLFTYPLAAFVFARDAIAEGPGRLRTSLWLMSVAFVMIHFYEAAVTVFSGPAVTAPGLLPWPAVAFTFSAYVATFVYVAVRRGRVPAARRRAHDAYLGLGVATLGLAALAVAAGSPAFAGNLSTTWDIAMPLVVAYGLLRLQLVDVDLKVKWSIKQSTVAAVFLAVIFVVSEGAQAAFAEALPQGGGVWLGIAAGAALLFALAPLQRFAERVADRAMPEVKPVEEMSDDERLDTYRRQVEIAWMDGSLGAKERLMLAEFREHLGIGADAADHLEREVAAGAAGAAGGEA